MTKLEVGLLCGGGQQKSPLALFLQLRPRLSHRRMNCLASLFMSVPNILISANHPDLPPSRISQGECGQIKLGQIKLSIFLFHYFQYSMEFVFFFCRLFSLFIRLWSTGLCFADTAKQNDPSYNSVQIREWSVICFWRLACKRRGAEEDAEVFRMGQTWVMGFDWVHTTS